MAVQSSFKQRCPSCEAMISVKETMIGKKVECTKCKDKFVAEAPEDELELELEEETPPPKKKSKKPADSDEIELELDPEAEAPPKKNKKPEKSTAVSGKAPPAKKSKVDDDDEFDDIPIEIEDEKPKKSTAVTSKAPAAKKSKLELDDEEIEDEKPKKTTAVTSKAPPAKKSKVDDDDEEIEDEKPKKTTAVTSKAPPAKKSKVDDEIDDIPVEVDDDDEPVQSKAKGKPPGRKSKDEDDVDEVDDVDDVDEVDEADEKPKKEEPKKKKDNANSNKLKIGLGLAVVGVVILCVAAFFLLRGGSGRQGGPGIPQPGNNPGNNPDHVDAEDKKPKKPFKQQPDEKKPEFVAVPLTENERAKLTNLLPPDTEHVFHVFADTAFAFGSPLRDAAFQVNALDDTELKRRLGFSLLALDDILVAERYSTPWKYTVLHFRDLVKEEDLVKALRLTVAGKIEGQGYYRFEEPHPWFDQLAHFSIGVPSSVRMYDARLAIKPKDNEEKPHAGTLLRLHNPQTLIVADEEPLKAFLNAKGEFPKLQGKEEKKEPAAGIRLAPGRTDEAFVSLVQPEEKEDPYMTIKESLKKMLDKMETRGPGDKVFFASATDMDASVVNTGQSDLLVRRPRQVWDATFLLTERGKTSRMRLLGANLVGKEGLKYILKNEMTVPNEPDARDIMQELTERGATSVARLVRRLVDHSINTPVPGEKKEEGKPEEKKDTGSEIRVNQVLGGVEFVIDLQLRVEEQKKIFGVFELMASTMRVGLDAAASRSPRHDLAQKGRLLGEKGLKDLNLPERIYPPGAFKRENAPFRTDKEPKNRISWMAGLLPYLGHENLFKRINFDQGWRDSSNWMAGNTVVPQFLDPTYPYHRRYVSVDGIPLDFAATHFVGIAGVGLDAAMYKRGDKNTEGRRGALGYDESSPLFEIDGEGGRGRSNTILMIQIPHDGIAGVRPWIAGGGATLRGVPEKNSIQPFVLTKDANDKAIRYKNRNGTYALMADGSVRFIDENVSDDAFKAMCTIRGTFKGYNANDPMNPLVPLDEAEKK